MIDKIKKITRIGKSIDSIFLEIIIVPTDTINKTHAIFPDFNHLGTVLLLIFNFFDTQSVGIMTVFMGHTYPQYTLPKNTPPIKLIAKMPSQNIVFPEIIKYINNPKKINLTIVATCFIIKPPCD